LIKDKKVGLIKRIREDSVYYVFPGGGIEDGETHEEGAKREALEDWVLRLKLVSALQPSNLMDLNTFFLLR
jgi:8-oxo-dGTP diphosphatase